MNNNEIKVLFFENKKWYMILARLIQYVSHKVYRYEPIIINHIAFVYHNKVYEFRWRKNCIISKYNDEYIKKNLRTNNIYSCKINIDHFNYKLLYKLQTQKYCIMNALAGYNSIILLGKKIGTVFNKMLDKFRNINEDNKIKQYCSKFFLLMYLNSLKKENKAQIIDKFHDFLLSEYRTEPYKSYHRNINKDIKMISEESIPQDFFIFCREKKKLDIKQL